MKNIKVLWMNNGEEETMQFVESALDHNIQIEPSGNWTLCRRILDNDLQNEVQFEAIIINAHCKTFEKEVPKTQNLGTAIKWLDNNSRKLPYFVINTKDSIEKDDAIRLESLLSSKKKKIFSLNDFNDLLDSIEEEVNNLPHRKYKGELAICKEQERISLLTLLEKLRKDEKDLERDHTIPNECRKVLEGIVNSFNEGVIIIPSISQKNSDLNTFSRIIGDAVDGIPEYIKRSFHTCCRVSQDGSHIYETDKLIKEGKAPFLTKALIFDLLNILYWLYDINNKEDGHKC